MKIIHLLRPVEVVSQTPDVCADDDIVDVRQTILVDLDLIDDTLVASGDELAVPAVALVDVAPVEGDVHSVSEHGGAGRLEPIPLIAGHVDDLIPASGLGILVLPDAIEEGLESVDEFLAVVVTLG